MPSMFWSMVCFIAGVQSWNKLSEGVSCSITQTPQGISISPSRREGHTFMGMPKELTICLPADSTPEQIGRGLREDIDHRNFNEHLIRASFEKWSAKVCDEEETDEDGD